MDIFTTFFNGRVLIETLPLLLIGLEVTVGLGLASIVSGMVFGLFVALVRLYALRPFQVMAIVYIDIFRSIPILVLLIIVYYALPFIGIRLTSFWAAWLTLTLISGAYTAEIFRAGIEAIPKGQFEGSQALGLNYFYMMVDVILPQAFKIVIPPLTNTVSCTRMVRTVLIPLLSALPTKTLTLNSSSKQTIVSLPTQAPSAS